VCSDAVFSVEDYAYLRNVFSAHQTFRPLSHLNRPTPLSVVIGLTF